MEQTRALRDPDQDGRRDGAPLGGLASAQAAGRITVNLATRTVEVDGRPLDLTAREYDLLETLYRRSVLDNDEARIQVGSLLIDLRTNRVIAAGRPVELSDKEFQVLELLALNLGRMVSKDMLLEHLYGSATPPASKILDVFVCKLRKKLTRACGGANYIRTVWGQGLVLDDRQPHSQQRSG